MSKEKELVDLLLQRTANGSQTWESTAANDEFITVIGAGIIVRLSAVSPRNPTDETPDIILAIQNEDGQEAMSIYNSEGDVSFQFLKTLHERAKRSALKIDETLDKALKILKRPTN